MPVEPVPTVDRALSPSAAELPVPDPDLLARADARSRIAVGAQVLYAAAIVALTGAAFLGLALPSDGALTMIDVVGLFGTLLALLVWKYSAYQVAQEFSPEPLDSTPGWAVGGYFIPFANLWLPFARMREIQQTAEADPLALGGQEGRSRGLIIAWWIVWIGSRILSRFATFDESGGETYGWILVVGASLASLMLTALVVFRLNEEQQAQAERRMAPEPVSLF